MSSTLRSRPVDGRFARSVRPARRRGGAARARALWAFRRRPEFASVYAAFDRASRIVPKGFGGEPQRSCSAHRRSGAAGAAQSRDRARGSAPSGERAGDVGAALRTRTRWSGGMRRRSSGFPGGRPRRRSVLHRTCWSWTPTRRSAGTASRCLPRWSTWSGRTPTCPAWSSGEGKPAHPPKPHGGTDDRFDHSETTNSTGEVTPHGSRYSGEDARRRASAVRRRQGRGAAEGPAPTSASGCSTEGNASMRELLGGKGAGLAEMSRVGLARAAGVHDHDRGVQPLQRAGPASSRRG